jgi:DNA-binding NarL/FixJ family response regulator
MKRPPRKTVLLVDDSRLVRERLLALISELPGVEVVGEASGVAEAIRKARRLRPDIILLDISMSDGSGIEVLETIKKSPRRLTPHIIMLTNFAHEAYRERCLELGAEYFFDKSAQFEEAVGMINELSNPSSRPASPPVRS